MEKCPFHLQHSPQGAVLQDADLGWLIGVPLLILVVDVDVPGIITQGPILEGLELVGPCPLGQDLALGELVPPGDDLTRLVELNAEEAVLKGEALEGDRLLNPRLGLARTELVGVIAMGWHPLGREDDPLCADQLVGHLFAARAHQAEGLSHLHLPLHQIAAHPAGGVENHQRRIAVSQVYLPHDVFQRLIECLLSPVHQLPVLSLALLVDGADGGAGDDVVELVEQDQFPAFVERLLRVVGSPQVGQRSEELSVVVQKLALAVGPLVSRLGGVGAPVELQIQLPIPHRQPRRILLQAAEEILRPPLGDAWRAGEILQPSAILQHLRRGPAAPVAETEGQQHLVVVLLLLIGIPGTLHLPGLQRAVVGGEPMAAGGVDEVGQHFSAIHAPPPEGVVGELVILVPRDLGSHEVLEARTLDDLGQGPGVAKDVGQPQHRAARGAEVLFKQPGAQEELAHQRLPARDVAVHLHPGAADGLPAPLCHPASDLRQQLRVILFDELVELSLALGEVVLGVALHQPEHGGEGSRRLLPRLSQGPQPGSVNVGVSHPHQPGLVASAQFPVQL